MSHTEKQDVTYYSGHAIEVNGKRYVPERTCFLIRARESYKGGGGVSIRCSACRRALPKRLAERWAILFCPKCGAKVVGVMSE